MLSAAGDDRLVDQLRRGNEAAFEAMYDRYHRPLLGYCHHLVGSQTEAEDVIQQVFAAVYRTVRERGERLELRPWLYTVARNTCISHLRRQRDLSGREMPAITPSPVAEAEQRADVSALVRDIATLPEDQRSALVLSELGDLSHEEIASVVGCERDKVKSLVHQARQRLFDRRRARDTSCDEVRDSLSTLRGGSLRRAWLKLHLRGCPGCREYRQEVLRQRAAMILAIPVPSAGLRDSVLAATGGGAGAAGGGAGAGSVAAGGGASSAGGTSAATVTGGVASMGASTSSGLLPALASSMAAKALAGAAIAGAAAGGGLAIHRAGGPEGSAGDRAATRQPTEREATAATGTDAAEPAPKADEAEESAAVSEPPPDEESAAYAESTETEASDGAEAEEEEGETEPETADEEERAAEEPGGSRERDARSRGERTDDQRASESREASDPAEAEGVEVEVEAPAGSKRRSAVRQLEDAVP